VKKAVLDALVKTLNDFKSANLENEILNQAGKSPSDIIKDVESLDKNIRKAFKLNEPIEEYSKFIERKYE
jgi:hypothetical protein